MAHNLLPLRFVSKAKESLFHALPAERTLPRACCEIAGRQEFADDIFHGFS
jgi:hypothetical protein